MDLITTTGVIIYLIFAIIILVIVFLLLRKFNCWYWKVDKRIELQQTTNELLNKILQKLDEIK